jgi:hypothetical protein
VQFAYDTHFFFVGSERKMPFVTVVTSDIHDDASNLSRAGVFRVNMGVRRETYEGMFGKAPAFNEDGSPVETGHDFTTLDAVMPHPIYAAMHWVCVLNPEGAWEKVKGLIGEAYGVAAGREGKRVGG